MIIHTLVFNNRYAYIFTLLNYWFLVSELIFISIVFVYIKDLIKKRCECSKSINRDITLIYTVTDGIIIVSSVLLAIIIAVYKFIS